MVRFRLTMSSSLRVLRRRRALTLLRIWEVEHQLQPRTGPLQTPQQRPSLTVPAGKTCQYLTIWETLLLCWVVAMGRDRLGDQSETPLQAWVRLVL